MRNFSGPLKQCLAPEPLLLQSHHPTALLFAISPSALLTAATKSTFASSFAMLFPILPAAGLLLLSALVLPFGGRRLHTPYNYTWMVHTLHLMACLLSRLDNVPCAGKDYTSVLLSMGFPMPSTVLDPRRCSNTW